MIKLLLLSVLLSSFVYGDVNYCIPHLPNSLDPHKPLDPIEEKIIYKVLRPLIPKEGQEGLAKDWKVIDKNTWRVTLKPGIKFNKTLGWKGLGDIGAKDVKFSIERQLKVDQRKISYSSASELRKKIKSLSVISFREIDLIFKEEMKREEFETIFSSQTGLIISEEFHLYKLKKEMKDDYFATTGDYTIENATSSQIKLTPVLSKNGINDTFFFKYLDPSNSDASSIKDQKCHYIFNPPLSLRKSIELAKLKAAKISLSTTRWFLILKPDLGLERNDLLLLHRRLNPDDLKELNGFSKIFNIVGNQPWIWPYVEKVELKNESEIDISFCRSNLHHSINHTVLQSEIKNKMTEFTGVKTNYYETSCEDVFAFMNDIDSSGTVLPLTYKKEEDIVDQLTCSETSIFFCLNPVKKSVNGINEAGLKNQMIFPLFSQENYFLRIF